MLRAVVVALVALAPRVADAASTLQSTHHPSAFDGAYVCVSDFAGGVAFNMTSRRWEGVVFRASEQFVLRLKYQRSMKDSIGADIAVFEATISKADQKRPFECVVDTERQFLVDASGGFECWALMKTYRINLSFGRFLTIYQNEYVDGIDNDDNTPSISGGTCTRIPD